MRRSGLRICPDRDAVCRAAALLFVELAEEAILARGVFRVALSGGTTPRRMYELLAENPLRGRVTWSEVEFFWCDERDVPPDHPDSHYRLACEALLDKLDLSPARVHRMKAERGDLDEAAREYQNEIADVFGVASQDAPPRFDLVVQAADDDGASALFPGPDEAACWIVGSEVPALASRRMTFTASLVDGAAQVLLLASGGRAALGAGAIEGERLLPAEDTEPADPDETARLWLIDEASAAHAGNGE